MEQEIKGDLHRLINYSVDMAELFLLKQNGEFYPFGAVIDTDGELRSVGYSSETEFPPSKPIIDTLKTALDERIASHEIKAYTIAYDSMVSHSPEANKSDTVVIDHFDSRTNRLTRYYYPYKLATKTQVEFGEPWAAIPS